MITFALPTAEKRIGELARRLAETNRVQFDVNAVAARIVEENLLVLITLARACRRVDEEEIVDERSELHAGG